MQSNRRWWTVSFSEQNRHSLLSIVFLFFSTLSLLSNLFLETNQRKKWTLGGTINFQTAGIDWHYTSKVNNRIKWLWRVNSWWIDLNCHTNESSSSYKEIELAGCTVSAHKFINLSPTHRLKVHFTFNPSHSSATVVVFSLCYYKAPSPSIGSLSLRSLASCPLHPILDNWTLNGEATEYSPLFVLFFIQGGIGKRCKQQFLHQCLSVNGF